MTTVSCQTEKAFDETVALQNAKLWAGRLCCQQAASASDMQQKFKKDSPRVFIFDPSSSLMNEHQARLGQL